MFNSQIHYNMTKNEHRLQGLQKAYYALCDAEKFLAGHTKNQELCTMIQNIKDKVSAATEELIDSAESDNNLKDNLQ